jgi:hypothetical protein
VCRYFVRDKTVWVEQLHGTAFLVNSDGYFVTASHVLRNGEVDVQENGGQLGIFPMQSMEGKPQSFTYPILAIEYAFAPFDICVVRTAYKCPTFFRLGQRDVEVWQEVATLGYPVSVTHKSAEHYKVRQRGHRGYVQRWIRAGDGLLGESPSSFELSFPVTRGMSGAPLFIHQRNHTELVIGVCVGSLSTESVDYENVIVEEGGATLKEKKVRVEEFGIAHDVRPLHEWRLEIANGKTLLELGSSSMVPP